MELADRVQGMLNTNNLEEIGALLNVSWNMKKQLASKISNSDIDDMYQKAIEAGALGGKILGAGGGGFLMLLVPEIRKEEVRRALSDYKEVPICFEPQGSKIIYVSD